MPAETRATTERSSLMLKRTIPLLVAVVIVLSAAPAVQACERCKLVEPETGELWCVGSLWGRTECEDYTGTCILSGDPCGPGFAAALSSEYLVASVERLDEAPAADETLVATLDVPATVEKP